MYTFPLEFFLGAERGIVSVGVRYGICMERNRSNLGVLDNKGIKVLIEWGLEYPAVSVR